MDRLLWAAKSRKRKGSALKGAVWRDPRPGSSRNEWRAAPCGRNERSHSQPRSAWFAATGDVSRRRLYFLLATSRRPASAPHNPSHIARTWHQTTTGSTVKSRAPLPAPAALWAASSIAWATASPAWVEALATGALPSLFGHPHDFNGNPSEGAPC